MATRGDWRDNWRGDEVFAQQGQTAFVDCPSCQTPNQFPQALGAVTLQCGSCTRQFQAAGQPSLTKVLSMTAIPITSAQKFESMSNAAAISSAQIRQRSSSAQRLSPAVSMTAPINSETTRDGEVSSPFDGISPDALVHDAISRCEQRTAAIAARTRELISKFGDYSPPRLSHNLSSASASNLVSGKASVAIPSTLPRGEKSFSTTILPEASQLQKAMSLQVMPPRQSSPMQGARSFSAVAPPGSQSFSALQSVAMMPQRPASPGARSVSTVAPPGSQSFSALQSVAMIPQRPASPMPGLGHRIRQGPMATAPNLTALIGSQSMASTSQLPQGSFTAPLSPAGPLRPRSVSPRPLPGGFLSVVPGAPTRAPPLSPLPGPRRSQTPSPWPAPGSVALVETASWVPVPPSPTLSVRSRSCSPVRIGPSRTRAPAAPAVELPLPTNIQSRSSTDCASQNVRGSSTSLLPSQMRKQEEPGESVTNGMEVLSPSALQDPLQRRLASASGKAAVCEAALETLGKTVEVAAPAADLANTALQGRSKISVPTSIPTLVLGQEPVATPDKTSERTIAADEQVRPKKDSGRSAKSSKEVLSRSGR